MTDELRHTDEIPSRASEFVADLNVHASGAWAIVALDTAFRTGMLAQLSVPRRIDDVARRTGAHPELVRGVADVLVSLGALEVREDGVVWAPWIRETDDAWRDSVAAKVRSVCLQTDAFRSDPRLTDQQDDSAPDGSTRTRGSWRPRDVRAPIHSSKSSRSTCSPTWAASGSI